MAANREQKQPTKHPRTNLWNIGVHCYKVVVWVVATKDVSDMYGKIIEISMLWFLNSSACAIVVCQHRCQNKCRNTRFGWHGKRHVANLLGQHPFPLQWIYQINPASGKYFCDVKFPPIVVFCFRNPKTRLLQRYTPPCCNKTEFKCPTLNSKIFFFILERNTNLANICSVAKHSRIAFAFSKGNKTMERRFWRENSENVKFVPEMSRRRPHTFDRRYFCEILFFGGFFVCFGWFSIFDF